MNKKNLLIWSAVALSMGFGACNKVAPVDPVDQPEATFNVRIVQDTKPGVRAIGDLSTDGISTKGLAEESAIKKTQVWIFSGSSLDGYGESATAEVKNISATTGSREVFIVVNGDGLSKTTSKQDLENAVSKLIPEREIKSTGLVMTADKQTFNLKEGKNMAGYGDKLADGSNNLVANPIPVSRINARVAIVSAKLELDEESKKIFDELKDVEVSMFNVQEDAKIFDPSVTSGQFLYGDDWIAKAGTYEKGAKKAKLLEKHFGFPIDIKKAPYFYVNPMAMKDKTFVVLRGKIYKSGKPVVAEGLYTDKEGYTYYPVYVNSTKEGYSYGKEAGANMGTGVLLRNTQYNISLTIKKIGNPTIDPSGKATVEVKTTVSPWVVVPQNVVW